MGTIEGTLERVEITLLNRIREMESDMHIIQKNVQEDASIYPEGAADEWIVNLQKSIKTLNNIIHVINIEKNKHYSKQEAPEPTNRFVKVIEVLNV